MCILVCWVLCVSVKRVQGDVCKGTFMKHRLGAAHTQRDYCTQVCKTTPFQFHVRAFVATVLVFVQRVCSVCVISHKTHKFIVFTFADKINGFVCCLNFFFYNFVMEINQNIQVVFNDNVVRPFGDNKFWVFLCKMHIYVRIY